MWDETGLPPLEPSKVPQLTYIRLLICFVTLAMLNGCASSTPAHNSVIKTLNAAPGSEGFADILVVSAAGDRQSRTQLQLDLAATISSDATTATAYYAVSGRNSTISRSILNNIIRVREFDAILLVRRQGQEQPDLYPNRPTGRKFDLYHYDYEELNDLSAINPDSTISFVAELYDTVNARKIWAIESLVFESDSVVSALSTQATVIANELQKDRLTRR
jgi:hypothetical protein